MSKNDLKEQYEDITALYDMAEELADTVEHKQAKNPEAQLTLVEPLINEIADSADVLTEEYIDILENPSHKKSAKTRIEKALRKIFVAMESYRERVKETATAAVSITDSIVNKIYKQTEKIMIIFMRLIDISLDRIMRKHELDEFRRNNSQFINMIPQHGH